MKSVDVLIIGAGVAGLTAAIYLKRSSLKMMIVDKYAPGGKLNNIHRVDNYPGVPAINGPELAMKLVDQATSLGIAVDYANVARIQKSENGFIVYSDMDEIETKAIIVATGLTQGAKMIPGEKEHQGKGVSYCATCDGAFFRNEVMAVYGYQDHAVEDALYLASIASKVYFIHPSDIVAAENHYSALLALDNVELIPGKVVAINGDPKVEAVEVESEGATKTLPVKALFLLEGEVSTSAFLSDLPVKMNKGFIQVGPERESSVPGIFAAGDILDKKLRQIVNAAGEGAEAATAAITYVKTHR